MHTSEALKNGSNEIFPKIAQNSNNDSFGIHSVKVLVQVHYLDLFWCATTKINCKKSTIIENELKSSF